MRALRRIVDAKIRDKPNADSAVFATKELHAAVNQVAYELDLVPEGQDFVSSKSLGWRLRRMRLSKPDARNPHAREWQITITKLEQMERARGISTPDKMSQMTEASRMSPATDVDDVPDGTDIIPQGESSTVYEESFK